MIRREGGEEGGKRESLMIRREGGEEGGERERERETEGERLTYI